MAGYRLELAGLACAGAIACGPSIEDAATEGDGATGSTHGATTTDDGTEGSAGGAATRGGTTEGTDGGSEGYPLTEGSSGVGSDTGPDLECQNRGEICGEFLVCQCSCDYASWCCSCEAAACTEDAHCEVGSVCIDDDDDFFGVELACVTAECAYPVDAVVGTAEDAASYAGVACLGSLTLTGPGVADLAAFESLVSIDGLLRIEGTALTDLGGLEGLSEIDGLVIAGNPALADIGALSNLPYIGQDHEVPNAIRDNPSLPVADVHAWLERLGGSVVEVCGNLDDVPCP